MATLKVEVVAIDSIMPHPNADRLDLVVVKGWQCVTGKGKYAPGSKVVYIPIDSILPADVECKLFPVGSKVTLSKSRVRTIKLRGAISQGMVADLSTLGLKDSLRVGTDVTAELGIEKFEPPAESVPNAMKGQQASKKQSNPHFRKYTDIENLKNYNDLFDTDEMVYVTEKLHGTSARYAVVPTEANTLWKKIKKFFGRLPSHEFCFGSRNVQLQSKLRYKGFYDENVYGKIAKQYNIEAILKPGEALYGEIVGDGIQKGYAYGCKAGEHKFAAYDVMVDGRWLNSDEFMNWCIERNIPRVPLLHFGPYDRNIMDKLRQGDSVFVPSQKVREGVVIKPIREAMAYCGRKVLKYINDEYLLKDQTDFH